MRVSLFSLRPLSSLLVCVLAGALCTTTTDMARAQAAASAQDQEQPPRADFDPLHASKEELSLEAWSMLSLAAGDKRAQTRIEALAALAAIGDAKSAAMISKAMDDPDLDVRTAAILAAGESKQTMLRGKMHTMLDDKEPQVAFAAATTLWKMKDYTGEDILVAVAAGDRSANAKFMNGTMHTMNKDLHNPGMLAKMGAMQGAAMLLGPFGFGIGAYEAARKNGGGDTARVTAIEQLGEERTAPVKAQLLDALDDKDAAVRAAAAKVLGTYHDADVSTALSKVMIDLKAPVRYTGAAAYLRSVAPAGTSGKKATGR